MDTLYLHLGSGVSVCMREVIGVFDMDNTTAPQCTRTLLEKAEKEHRIRYVSQELPKSFVVTVHRGVCVVFVSPLAAATLKARLVGS